MSKEFASKFVGRGKELLQIGAVSALAASGFYAMHEVSERENAKIDAKCGGPGRENCIVIDTRVCSPFSGQCSGRIIYEVKTPTPPRQLIP
jgi:hypothetical protein